MWTPGGVNAAWKLLRARDILSVGQYKAPRGKESGKSVNSPLVRANVVSFVASLVLALPFERRRCLEST